MILQGNAVQGVPLLDGFAEVNDVVQSLLGGAVPHPLFTA